MGIVGVMGIMGGMGTPTPPPVGVPPCHQIPHTLGNYTHVSLDFSLLTVLSRESHLDLILGVRL